MSRARREEETQAIIEQADASLLELVDHVLTKGVVLTGDIMLGLANVDLVYFRVSVLLCAADRVTAPGTRP